MRYRFKSIDDVRKAFPMVAFPKVFRDEPAPKKSMKRTGALRAIASADKKGSKRYQRRKTELDLLKLWSVAVRKRDGGRCQWCTSDNKIQAHHIVARSVASKIGWFALDNGVALCTRCHLYRLKSDPDAYIEWRDRWLSGRNLTYAGLKAKYTMRVKMSVDDMQLMKLVFEKENEK